MPRSTSGPATLTLIAFQLFAYLTPTLASIPGPRGIASNVLGSAASVSKRADGGYTDPAAAGGDMLTYVNGTFPAGLGEPLNVILSADSDKEVLVPSVDDGGFLNYMLSTQFGEECLGQKLGSSHDANLGDGQGNKTERETLRWNYGDPYLGTCRETFEGGNHLRYWIQNNTGAYFMAVSVEMDANKNHDIVPNGYNLGRDYMVGNLTGTEFDSRNVTNQTTFSGTSTWKNYTYQTDVRYVSGLLQNSSEGVNHYITVEAQGQPAIDGLVAVLTVRIMERPQSSALAVLSRASLAALVPSLILAALFILA